MLTETRTFAWASHNPTTHNRQGWDIGSQPRRAANRR